MRGVDYIIVTEDNITEVWAELEAAGKPIVLFALTSDGYENLALNSAEIIRFLSEQRAVIIAYKEYYEKADKTIDSYNKDNKLDEDEKVEGSSLSSIKKFLSVD
jgi:mitochondrial fission protein ELM1